MTTVYDVIVIGAGPAGMMAAGTAAHNGARVLLLEKNDRPGKKLLLTGSGRCNITTIEQDPKKLVGAYGRNGRFLYSALHEFGTADTLSFFKDRGLALKVEKEHKVFPASDRAGDVLDILILYCEEHRVTLRTGCTVQNMYRESDGTFQITTGKGSYLASSVIIATGGLSYPSTGSSGDGYRWAKDTGHTIIEPRPALMPLLTDETWVHGLQGLSLANVTLSVLSSDKRVSSIQGDLMFTHYGLVSPEILNLSERTGLLLRSGEVCLEVDLFPNMTGKQLDEFLIRLLGQASNKELVNALSPVASSRLLAALLELSEIDPHTRAHSLTKDDRRKLISRLKRLLVPITAVAGFEKAIITAGGVALDEIDPRTMRSRIVESLYFAGEVLDLHGPTGGYNLQVAWSTGYLAGKSAALASPKQQA